LARAAKNLVALKLVTYERGGRCDRTLLIGQAAEDVAWHGRIPDACFAWAIQESTS